MFEPDYTNNIECANEKLCPCEDCGSLISKRAKVCPKCGAPREASAPENNRGDISLEQKIATYRPSVLNYLWMIVLGVITVPMIVGVFILLWVVIEITCTRYELTSHRVIVRRGLISKMQNEIWIKDMRAVNLIQGIWQRIIGVGDVAIGTAATAQSEISITGVANPSEIVTQINSLRQS